MERAEIILLLKHELHQADYFEQNYREISVDLLRACVGALTDDEYNNERN